MDNSVRLHEQHAVQGVTFDEFVVSNGKGCELHVLTYGAAIHRLFIPLAEGSPRQILMQAEISGYFQQDAFMGATVGRYANRIRNGIFEIDGERFQLDRNNGKHCLHGGPRGFDKQVWDSALTDVDGRQALQLSLLSPDGDQGFPGNCNVQAVFFWNRQDDLEIRMTAAVDQPCPVALTSHGYFNLNGVASDSREHFLQLSADRYLPVDATGAPSNGLCNVEGTSFDFRKLGKITDRLNLDGAVSENGYDHGFLLQKSVPGMTQPAAILISPDKRLGMELYSNQPAIQFYTARFYAGQPAPHGKRYSAYDALCLEPGCLADTPNRSEFGDCIVRPGQTYENRMILRFRPGSHQ